jgi:hypothetical protein
VTASPGLTNPAYFSRAFRAASGLAPVEYRQAASRPASRCRHRRTGSGFPPALATRSPGADNHAMAVEPRMVFLGFGKFARADKIYALEPLRGDQRGDGRRTNVWVEGIDGPIVASRTERTILHDMGQDPAAPSPIVDEALDLAERLVAAADAGRVDLGDLGRRARHLLAATTAPPRDGPDGRG